MRKGVPNLTMLMFLVFRLLKVDELVAFVFSHERRASSLQILDARRLFEAAKLAVVRNLSFSVLILILTFLSHLVSLRLDSSIYFDDHISRSLSRFTHMDRDDRCFTQWMRMGRGRSKWKSWKARCRSSGST